MDDMETKEEIPKGVESKKRQSQDEDKKSDSAVMELEDEEQTGMESKEEDEEQEVSEEKDSAERHSAGEASDDDNWEHNRREPRERKQMKRKSESASGNALTRFRRLIRRPFDNVWTFIILYLSYSLAHGIQATYTIAVLTTLEKRFNMPSSMAGFLVTAANVGYIISVIFVSFFFAKKHPPRLFALCMLLSAFGSLLAVTPHFVYGTGNDDIDIAHAQGMVINSSAEVESGNNLTQICAEVPNVGLNHSGKEACSESEKLTADKNVAFIWPAIVLIVISEVIGGVSGAPIWTVGLAYIDDRTGPELSAKLIGVMFTAQFSAPLLSFAMGGYLLSIYANLRETGLTPEHPRWIGAWWMGYLVCLIIYFVLCIPTFMVPRDLKPLKKSVPTLHDKKEKHEMRMRAASVTSYEVTRRLSAPYISPNMELPGWTDLFKAIKRLVTNPIYMIEGIALCIDCSVFGYMTFLPKYFEVQFHKTAWQSNLLGGMIPALFGGIASYIGGVVSGKFKGIDGGVMGNSRMNCLSSFIGLLLLIVAMFLSCPNDAYNGSLTDYRLNVTTDCNFDCGCSMGLFDPVCGSDGNIYFSPCHAGCSDLVNPTSVTNRSEEQVFAYNCRCIKDLKHHDGRGGEGIVLHGFCYDSCVSLIPFIIVVAGVFISTNLYNVPSLNINIRSVREEDKSLALGFQTLLICLCVLPAPVLYGIVFDSSCILKETTSCSESNGNCLFYDRNALRLVYHGLAIGLRSTAVILYCAVYFLARRQMAALRVSERNDVPT